jgi:hypothetical protein
LSMSEAHEILRNDAGAAIRAFGAMALPRRCENDCSAEQAYRSA